MAGETVTDKWIRTLRRHEVPRVRVICFAHAGGSAGSFTPLARKIDGPIEVLAVQPPGRQERRREPCLESVAELVAGVLPAVRARADLPIALFGHSLGGAVAFELTRLLEAEGIPPRMLFISGRRAPEATLRAKAVHQRSDAGLMTELRLLGGPGVHLLEEPEIARAFLPAIRSDYRAIETYTCPPDARVQVPLSVLTGDRDPEVTHAEAQGWRERTTGPFELQVFDGGHFYLWEQLDAVAETVSRQLLAVTA